MSYSPLFRGSSSAAPSVANASGYQNGTVGTIAIATPVSTDTSGQLVLTDVTDGALSEAWLGLTETAIPTTANGQVIGSGRIQEIPLGLGFSVGDPIWVGSTPGTLTNVRPDLSAPGWSVGDYVLFVGVVVKNEYNPSLQDIQISKQIIGQL